MRMCRMRSASRFQKAVETVCARGVHSRPCMRRFGGYVSVFISTDHWFYTLSFTFSNALLSIYSVLCQCVPMSVSWAKVWEETCLKSFTVFEKNRVTDFVIPAGLKHRNHFCSVVLTFGWKLQSGRMRSWFVMKFSTLDGSCSATIRTISLSRESLAYD